jgi:hypothetical protein
MSANVGYRSSWTIKAISFFAFLIKVASAETLQLASSEHARRLSLLEAFAIGLHSYRQCTTVLGRHGFYKKPAVTVARIYGNLPMISLK